MRSLRPIVLLPLAASLVVPVHAQGPRAVERPPVRDLSDTVRRVERRTGGEVLSAERVQFDGRDLHRVKVVEASGRVRVYMDDPRADRSPTRTRDDDD